MALLLRVDGTRTPVTPATPAEGFTLDELYAHLGCSTVEVLYLPDGRMLVMDGDGKVTPVPFRKPTNHEATSLARLAGIAPLDYVVGDVLLCDKDEVR